MKSSGGFCFAGWKIDGIGEADERELLENFDAVIRVCPISKFSSQLQRSVCGFSLSSQGCLPLCLLARCLLAGCSPSTAQLTSFCFLPSASFLLLRSHMLSFQLICKNRLPTFAARWARGWRSLSKERHQKLCKPLRSTKCTAIMWQGLSVMV